MRVVIRGDRRLSPEPKAPWWIGRRFTCTFCSQVVEGEDRDPEPVKSNEYPGWYRLIFCQNCQKLRDHSAETYQDHERRLSAPVFPVGPPKVSQETTGKRRGKRHFGLWVWS